MTKRNIVHVEIPAADVEKVGEFYKSLFGWEIQPIPEMNYTMWDAGDGSAGGFPEVSDEYPAGKVLIYINSDDIEADLKKAIELGGKIVREKAEIPNTGWYGMFKDPTGNTIALYTSMNPEFNQ
jgi:predicted enzyme related to lactoylglutathione lyase